MECTRGASAAEGDPAPRRSGKPGRGKPGKQLELPLRSRGGARPGAGRKPKGARAGVSHLRRPSFRRGQPLHVTLHVHGGLASLRTRKTGRVIFAAFAKARERLSVRLTHFSIQENHLHLLVEASDRASLSRAMQGLGIRLAKRLNGALGRHGGVFSDRYHARVLKTPLEVRRAILYVLNNYRRHLAQAGGRAPWDWADPYSSVDYFDGFRNLDSRNGGALGGELGSGEDGRSGGTGRRPVAEFALGRDPPVAPARSWLLTVGWRRRGLLSVDECPGGRRR